MIVDASALVAVAKGEPGWHRIVDVLAADAQPRISAATWLEACIVVDGARDPTVTRRFDRLLADAGISVVPVDEEQARIARAAYRDFGRGSGHPARLNFGDCFSYALASVTGEPLLFTGGDFTHTDVGSALP
ncbi:MAG: type II toxin-antitoxin system VapC family toxin [Nocardioides sp.]